MLHWQGPYAGSPCRNLTRDAALQQLTEQIIRRPRVTVLTGAGVSAASGIPTFRGPEGLWRRHRPEQLATPQAFGADPQLVWEWYAWRRERVAGCRPNRAHEVLAAWSRRLDAFRLVTQNVDGLHERAGTRDVIRFHGSLWEMQCWSGCAGAPARWWDETVPFPHLPPRCPHCGGLARPGVVWFGESIDPRVLERSLAATACDLLLAIGTSAVVHPAAGLLHEARRHGALTAEINPDETPVSEVADLSVRGRAEEILDLLERRLTGPGS